MQENKPRRRLRNDLLLAIIVLVVALAALLILRLTRAEGATVQVTVDGELYASYPLSEDTRVTIGDGEHSNTLVISDGEAWVEDASCPDKLCEQQGRIHYDDEMIVCLPNKFVVQITGGEKAEEDFTLG